jgi:methyl-accepting chemotaxis protein
VVWVRREAAVRDFDGWLLSLGCRSDVLLGEDSVDIELMSDWLEAYGRELWRAGEAFWKFSKLIYAVAHGAESCGRVGSSLDEIASKIAAADTLVAEIATAAREQSQGIGQIGDAMTELDKVTQENAARAEEGASAAAELTSQSQLMREHVEWLRSLVTASAQPHRPAAATAAVRQPSTTSRALPRPSRTAIAARIPMPGDTATSLDAEERNFKDF